MNTQDEKKKMREEIKSKIRKVKDCKIRSKTLLEKLKQTDSLQDVQNIAIFVSLSDEVQTSFIVKYCWQNDISVYIPECNCHSTHKEVKISMRKWEKEDSFNVSGCGIAHPLNDKLIECKDVELILVPGLAFTKEGKRLGRGGGFYDRLLNRYKGNKIGLCFKEQIKKDLPSERHDRRVDQVISC